MGKICALFSPTHLNSQENFGRLFLFTGPFKKQAPLPKLPRLSFPPKMLSDVRFLLAMNSVAIQSRSVIVEQSFPTSPILSSQLSFDSEDPVLNYRDPIPPPPRPRKHFTGY